MNTEQIHNLTLIAASATAKKTPVILDFQERPSSRPLHQDSVVQLGYAVKLAMAGDTGSLDERIESARLERTGVTMVEKNGCMEYVEGSEPTVGDLEAAHIGDASIMITAADENAEIEIYA